ncbi:MAG: DUF4249 domain-containing protein [Flavobacteriales bacterium]|nr:DUF4249 domain-containing protein [Flavobacteriales bacterium]
MRLHKIILSVAILSLSWACEKEIPLTSEEIKPRIVVNSIFSANDTIRIHLSESRDVLYDEFVLPNITTANAQLLNSNGNVIGNFVHEEEGRYVCTDIFPTIGDTYGISVTNEGFDDVTATSETPDIVSFVSIDTVRKNEQLEFDIQFTDNGDQANYYALSIITMGFYEDEFGDTVFYEYPNTCSSDIIVQNGSGNVDGAICSTELFFNDKTFNGTNYTFTAQSYIPEDIEAKVVVKIKSLSEDLYKYKISYSKYINVQGSVFAEPVQVYSNIENGFGIFGGYSEATDTLYFE